MLYLLKSPQQLRWMPFINAFFFFCKQMRELSLVRLSHLSIIIEAANVDTVFKEACPRVQVNTVALENIWLYSTFGLCFKDCRQMENFRGPECADWTCRVNFTEKTCPPGICQVHLHPCSPGHKERSLSVKGTGPGLGAKKQKWVSVSRFGLQGNAQSITLGFSP